MCAYLETGAGVGLLFIQQARLGLTNIAQVTVKTATAINNKLFIIII
jgi:hypothetical protein